jgi:hypothetical protein
MASVAPEIAATAKAAALIDPDLRMLIPFQS